MIENEDMLFYGYTFYQSQEALKHTNVYLSKGKHQLKITALDNHIIVDQWMVDFATGRHFYVIPTNVK